MLSPHISTAFDDYREPIMATCNNLGSDDRLLYSILHREKRSMRLFSDFGV